MFDEVLTDDETLSGEEEAAIMAFAVVLSETQLSATIHFFAHELARRSGNFEPGIMEIPLNVPGGHHGMIVLPGGKT